MSVTSTQASLHKNDLLHTISRPNSSKMSSPWLRRQFDNQPCPGKLQLREILFDFFKEEVRDDIGLLSLPGASWGFEQAILNEWQFNRSRKAFFTGFEHDERVIDRAAGMVPTAEYRKPGRVFEGSPHWQEMSYIRGVKQFNSGIARWVHMDVNDWFNLGLADMAGEQAGDKVEAFNKFKTKGWNFNAIWLDYMGPICPKMELGLSRLAERLMPSRFASLSGPMVKWHGACDSIPFAVTVLKGRERPEVMRRLRDLKLTREQYIYFLLARMPYHRIEDFSTFEYTSNAGSRMLTVMGKWVPA